MSIQFSLDCAGGVGPGMGKWRLDRGNGVIHPRTRNSGPEPGLWVKIFLARCAGSCIYYRAIKGVAIVPLKSKLFLLGKQLLYCCWFPGYIFPHLSDCKRLGQKNWGRRETRIVIGQKEMVGGQWNRASGCIWVQTKAWWGFGVGGCKQFHFEWIRNEVLL